MRTRGWAPVMVLLLVLGGGGCDLLDPARPTPQPDTEIFGNLLDVTEQPDAPGTWVVTLRVGAPRALSRAEEGEGRPATDMEEGISAAIKVHHDTVVMAGDRPVAVRDVNLGTEMVAIPVPGTTMMIGSSNIEMEASMLLDFETYRRWRLPRLETGSEPAVVEDPNRINSSGVEQAPVPVADGRVLYFSARLRPPVVAGRDWIGARRDGLQPPAEGEHGVERSYRAELGEAGWSVPALVSFPGLEQARSIRVSWVSEDETRALVTVIEADARPWAGLAERAGASAAWGQPRRLDELGEDAADAVYLAGSSTRITFVSARGGGHNSDLYLYDAEAEDQALPLEPRVNTLGNEWMPRVGPDNELFFLRGDRQMVLMGGAVQAVRLPGPHRSMVSQVSPTADGKWLFLCLPRLRPVELDQDIYVARWNDDRSFGEPVPVDDWRR